MKHFKLTTKSKINLFGVKLFQIELTVDCKWGNKKEKGGWIEKECNLGNAMVYGNAEVFGDAIVSGNARVYGDARVSGNARVYGNAIVYGDAEVFGDAMVYGNAEVFGDAIVSGNARVSGDAWKQSPLQIRGSIHFLNESKKGYLQIGCHEYSFKYWKDNYKRLGKSENYSDKQIKEYSLYIDLAIKLSKL